MKSTRLLTVAVLSVSLLSSLVVQADHLPKGASVLTLDSAITVAQTNDPWLVGNRHTQDAVESMSIASGTLADPKVSISVANIAADTFNFSQEPMTQFKVGVSQMLPRGDSLSIKKQQLQILSQQFPFQREDRKAKIKVTVGQLWLDAYQAQESIALIEKDRSLFEQLADVAQASYSSAVGKTRQQDLVRAQLELTLLDDRLTVLNQNLEMSQEKLAQWLSSYLSGNNDQNQSMESGDLANYILARKLPTVEVLSPSLVNSKKKVDAQHLFNTFASHPSVLALEKKILASNKEIDLAKQKYKSEWGINASYGYRDANPLGVDRSDLFSVGVSFDLPIFTSNKQDQQVRSAISKTSKVKTEKWLLVRKMIASFEASKVKFHRINQRKELYKNKLLPQMHDQAEASLTAYTNDDGDFAEVVRSRIAELNATIDYLAINVERQKNILQLNYFLVVGEKK